MQLWDLRDFLAQNGCFCNNFILQKPTFLCLYNSEPCLLFFKPWIALSRLNIEMCRLVLILEVQPRVLPCLDKLRLIYIISCDYDVLLVVSGSDLTETCIELLRCCRKTLFTGPHLSTWMWEHTLSKMNQFSVYWCNCCSHFMQTWWRGLIRSRHTRHLRGLLRDLGHWNSLSQELQRSMSFHKHSLLLN